MLVRNNYILDTIPTWRAHVGRHNSQADDIAGSDDDAEDEASATWAVAANFGISWNDYSGLVVWNIFFSIYWEFHNNPN